jgi:type I restriction enzyme S subunit
MTASMNVPQLRFPEFSGEWKERKLEDLFIKIRNGFVGVATPYYVENGVKYLQGKNVKNGIIDDLGLIYVNDFFHKKYQKSHLKINDILMVQSGHVGECAVVDEKYDNANCHALIVLTPKNDVQVSSKFLVYYFYSPCGKQAIHKIKTGNTIEHILASEVKVLSLSFSCFEEQTKIASFLSAVDTKIDQLTQKKALLETYKKGAMQQIFSQQIRFKADDGEEYPEWEDKKLGAFCSFFSGGTPASTNKEYYSGNIPFIGSGKIGSSIVEQFITEEALANSSAKMVKKGDLLYALYGATSGEVAISKIDGAINQAVLCIRSKENIFFIFYWLFFEKENILSTYLQGGQGNLSAQIIKSLVLPLPSYEEQTKIAAFLSAIDQKIDFVSQQLKQAKAFKKGLLQQMFV